LKLREKRESSKRWRGGKWRLCSGGGGSPCRVGAEEGGDVSDLVQNKLEAVAAESLAGRQVAIEPTR
jgi:hypothetical protein